MSTPLSDAETLQALIILGLASRTDVVFYYYGDSEKLRQAEIAKKALTEANDAQLDKIREILAKFKCVEYETDLVEYQGVSISPYRMRLLLKTKMADTIGFEPPGRSGYTIARG